MIHPDDREPFGEAVTRLFAIYGDEVTATLLEAWWGVLARYELREVRWAMNRHAIDPDKGRFKPMPADIIRHITETLPAARAQRHRERVLAARETVVPMEAELYRLQTDLKLGLIPADDVQAARERINGLCTQIGSITREAGIDDRAHVSLPPTPLAAIVGPLRAIKHED